MTAAAKEVLEEAVALSDNERMDLMTDSNEPLASDLSLERGEVEPAAWERVEAKESETLAGGDRAPAPRGAGRAR